MGALSDAEVNGASDVDSIELAAGGTERLSTEEDAAAVPLCGEVGCTDPSACVPTLFGV